SRAVPSRGKPAGRARRPAGRGDDGGRGPPTGDSSGSPRPGGEDLRHDLPNGRLREFRPEGGPRPWVGRIDGGDSGSDGKGADRVCSRGRTNRGTPRGLVGRGGRQERRATGHDG